MCSSLKSLCGPLCRHKGAAQYFNFCTTLTSNLFEKSTSYLFCALHVFDTYSTYLVLFLLRSHTCLFYCFMLFIQIQQMKELLVLLWVAQWFLVTKRSPILALLFAQFWPPPPSEEKLGSSQNGRCIMYRTVKQQTWIKLQSPMCN